jgi:hypothetical protein
MSPVCRTVIPSILLALPTLIRAQTSPEKPPSFEVASVKASPKGQRAHLPAIDPSLLSVKGTTLKGLVMLAYSVPPTDSYRVAGGPGWVDTDPYDVDARPAAPSSRADMISMLRSLLADRFRLLVHREVRDVTMNVLVVAKGGPRFGPQFHAVVDGDPPSDLGRLSITHLSYPGITIEAESAPFSHDPGPAYGQFRGNPRRPAAARRHRALRPV